MAFRASIAAFLLLVIALSGKAADPVRIFFDTDMETDCDDAAAMAVFTHWPTMANARSSPPW
jgi:hypothetical protein